MTAPDELAAVSGYRVDTRDGRIGNVVAVLRRVGDDVPGVLIVQTGKLVCNLTAIGFDEVESVDADAGRIVLGERELAAAR